MASPKETTKNVVFDLPKITKAIKENHCFLMENSKRGKGVTIGGI